MKLDRFFNKKRKKKDYTLKVVDVQGSPLRNNLEIHYQVCGKSSTSYESPKALVSDLVEIKGFSESDSKLILDLMLTEINSPNYLIISTNFKFDKTTVKLKDTKNNLLLSLTPQQILSCDEIKLGLPRDQLEQICYLNSRDQYNHEKKNLLNIKKKEKINLYVYSSK